MKNIQQIHRNQRKENIKYNTKENQTTTTTKKDKVTKKKFKINEKARFKMAINTPMNSDLASVMIERGGRDMYTYG